MRCTVCHKSPNGNHGWSLTTERTSCSGLQIIFKLFHITHLEFSPGAICPQCHGLVQQIDCLEHKLRCLADHGTELDPDFDHQKEPKMNLSVDLGRRNDEDQSKHLEEDLIDCSSDDDQDTDRLKENLVKDKEANIPSLMKTEESCLEVDEDMSTMATEDTVSVEEEDSEEEYGENTFRPRQRGRKSTPTDPMVPKVAKANFSQENLDYNVMLSKTNKGKDMLVYKRYVYHGDTRRDNAGYTNIFKWKCAVKHRFKGCKGRLTSSIDGSCVLKDSVVEHYHKPPHGNLTKRHQFKEHVRDLALNNPDMKPSEVIRNAQLLSSEDPEQIGFTIKALTCYVQKMRKRNNDNDNKEECNTSFNALALKKFDEMI